MLWLLIGIISLIAISIFIIPLLAGSRLPESGGKGEGRWLLYCLILLLPILMLGYYWLYGESGALVLWEKSQDYYQQRDALAPSAQQLGVSLISELDTYLSKKPDDEGFLALQAVLFWDQGNYKGASDRYAQLMELYPDRADISGRYIEALYLGQGRKLSAEQFSQAEALLEKQPENRQLLGLLGIYAFEQNNYPQAEDYWSRLLPLIPDGEPEKEQIQRGIEVARERQK